MHHAFKSYETVLIIWKCSASPILGPAQAESLTKESVWVTPVMSWIVCLGQ